MPLSYAAPEMIAQVSGTPDPDNTYVAIAFPGTGTTFNKPTNTADTRPYDVFAGDLGFTWDGLDGNVYGLFGDTFGTAWIVNTTNTRAGSTTLASAMNGKAANNTAAFTVAHQISMAAAGSFSTSGGYCAIEVSADSNKLAYYKYTARSSANLTGCTYLGGSTGNLSTSDRIKGTDDWNSSEGNKGWRSNTCFRSPTTNLSSGYTIDAWKNLDANNRATQAIGSRHDTQAQNNVFQPARTVGASGAVRTSNVVTITTTSAHGFSLGQTITVAGMTDTAFNGEFVISTLPGNSSLTYAQTGANATTGSGTVRPIVAITSISLTSWAGSVTTSSPHGFSVGQYILIAGTGVSDGELKITSTPTTTTFGYSHVAADSSASTGTVQGANLANQFITTPGAADEGSLIPSGCIAVAGAGAAGATRHYAFYWTPAYFAGSLLFGQTATWFSNYMGIAYSDDYGATWTRSGVTGGTYGTVDTAKVWINDSQWLSNFQQAWPVDGGDGYIYCLCTGNGRPYGAYMMRVLKANILTPSSYTYWDGSSWSATIGNAASLWSDGTGEPSLFYSPGAGRWVATYLSTSLHIVARDAANPWGPYTSSQTIVNSNKFAGGIGQYGAFVHPWSAKSPNDSGDFYFHVSVFDPYNTYLIRVRLKSAKRARFFAIP